MNRMPNYKEGIKYYQVIRLLEIKFFFNMDIEEIIFEYLLPRKKYLIESLSQYQQSNSQNNKYKYNMLNLDNKELKISRCAVCDGLISVRYIIIKKLNNCYQLDNFGIQYKKCKKIIQYPSYNYHKSICWK